MLLRAYFTEFTAKDNVVLYLHTYLYLDSDPRNEQRIRYKINDYVRQLGLDSKNLPEVAILSNELLEFDMPKLYKAMDAFVLPSRGEGWGLPIMEGMNPLIVYTTFIFVLTTPYCTTITTTLIGYL